MAVGGGREVVGIGFLHARGQEVEKMGPRIREDKRWRRWVPAFGDLCVTTETDGDYIPVYN